MARTMPVEACPALEMSISGVKANVDLGLMLGIIDLECLSVECVVTYIPLSMYRCITSVHVCTICA